MICRIVEPKDRTKTIGKRAPDGAWEIPIIGEVGSFDLSGEALLRELMWVKPTSVRFVIYSPGGYVYDAIAVAGWITEHNIECYAEIYGLCASAATVYAALAGPKRTAIAPGSMFLVHQPYGGDEKSIENATSFLVDLYIKAYGWTKAEAKAHMEASNGEGILWDASESKKLGVAGEIMEGAKVAAHYQQNLKTMSKNTITAKAVVKLSAIDAVKAALSEGVTVDVEIDADKVSADAIAAKDAEIAKLTKEVEDMKAKAAEGDAANAEAEKAKADIATATEALTKALDEAKAAHAKEIAELKKPLAKATVPDNQEAKTELGKADPVAAAVKTQFFKDMTPIQRAAYDRAMKAKAAAK